ncbi:uncharacterized protein [Henckelia pumila]|uniref:uncharacterized protein n=1 Tax=Henckelia pumila TaxID=405737 RepID=UPI003C6E01F6
MELGLSLGDTRKPFSLLHEKSQKMLGLDLGLICMDNIGGSTTTGHHEETASSESDQRSSDPTVQLRLLPFSPLHTTHPPPSTTYKFPFPWPNDHNNTSFVNSTEAVRGEKKCEEWVSSTKINNNKSYHHDETMDYFSIFKSNNKRTVEYFEEITANSRGTSDEEDHQNGVARKKLRLSKEQSAFLEDSFKEHNTLNPKQKVALAKELNLRPRQVEVWFQNRRARTKLKQTEVDYEYLKRCCETLTEENKRLQKELQELRALNKATNPFYKHLPATTLTMCPSCERIATATTAAATGGAAASANKPAC